MGFFSALWRFLATPLVAFVLLAALGAGLGYGVFFHVYPQKPKIGIIDIPFTVITDRSATVITSYMDYARNRSDIKGVVIRLSTPGGGAAASERLLLETQKLREEKPVVIRMGGLVASGGYMMSMGGNYLYASPSSLVGNVGVILSYPGPYVPDPPLDHVVMTGPDKLYGGDRRHFVAITDQLKRAFAGMVVRERGDLLRLSYDELVKGRVYAGVEAVNLGMADEIGGDTEAVAKAAALAGVSNYGTVDVNAHVAREFNETLRWIYDPLLLQLDGQGVSGQLPGSFDDLPLESSTQLRRLLDSEREQAPPVAPDLEVTRNILPHGGIGPGQDEALPGFPMKINTPNIYYLYVGPSQ